MSDPAARFRVLVADDDTVSRLVLERTLAGWGYPVTAVKDGAEAWEALRGDDPPALAVLDWMMPGFEGPELCRMARELARPVPTYLILLTGKGTPADVAAGLDSGADDYVTKPFDRAELRSRLRIGEKVIGLQQAAAERAREFESAWERVKPSAGPLPVCESSPEVRTADARRQAAARLGWDRYCVRVWLDDPPQVRVSAVVYAAFARELAAFFRDLAGRPPRGADESRRVASSDDELCVEAWPDRDGMVGLGVTLASDMWDPHWVVRVNLVVGHADLPGVAAAAERLARYADGLPPEGRGQAGTR